ncbi:MAG TPA: glycosyltransferase family 39 protein [Thermoanaerobaculia bacterium]|nr:glycosyltransferase family 39 protein [Thermoanaerobaculia bacterium]
MRSTLLLKVSLLVCVAAIAIHLGGLPLIDTDEGRNAEVAREMAETNDYVVPRLNTVPYLDKPIVYFAAQAALMEVLGPTELAARLPAYFFTLATAALIFWFARRRIGEEEAWVAAIAYLAMPLTMAFARVVIFDSTLAFFIAVAIVAFHEAIELRDRRWTALAWAAIGFGVLTKGPVAIAVPLLVALPYAIWRKAAPMLWSVAGLMIFAAVVTPWVWAISRVVPDFLYYVLVTETVARLTSEEMMRSGPPWYFLPYFVAGAAPWTVAVVANWRDWSRRDGRSVFLLLWVLVPLVFFSLSESKRAQYILPVMPAVALLVALSWQTFRPRAAAVAMALFGAVLLVGPSLPQFSRIKPAALVEPARSASRGYGLVFLAGGAVALASRDRRTAFLSLALPVVAMPAIGGPFLYALSERRSQRSFVAELAPHLSAQTEVIGVEMFTGSLAFYLQRPIILVTADASELTSNYIVRRYQRFSGQPGVPVKPLPWFAQSLERCCDPRIYLVRDDDPHHQDHLESRGARLLATGTHYFAYAYSGPQRRRSP